MPVPQQESHSDDVLDAATVAELRDLGSEPFDLVYRQFLNSLDESLIALRAGSAGTPPLTTHAIAALAHRLKGGSAAVGALALADVCRRLEEAASRDPAWIGDALSDLEREAVRVRTRVVALLT